MILCSLNGLQTIATVETMNFRILCFIKNSATSFGLAKSRQNYRVSHKEGIDKKLSFGAAQGLNLQFLNLLGFSISVSFV